MAPRGRQRKVGLKRIDAAVDAMRPLGFSKTLVCKTVNKLLKVYEGYEGWIFIEEASYKLLIETILEDLEENQQQLLEDKQQPPQLLVDNQQQQPPQLLEDNQPQQQQPPQLLEDNQPQQQQPPQLLEDNQPQQQQPPQLLEDNQPQQQQPPQLLEDNQPQQQQPPQLLEDPLEVQIACQRRGLEIDYFFNEEEEEANLPTTKLSRTYAYGWIVCCHHDNYNYDEETDAHSHLIFQQYKNRFQTDRPQTNLTRKRRTRWDVGPSNMN